MENSQYVHSLLPFINQEIDFIIFMIRFPDAISCQFFIFIQFMALRKQAETVYCLPKASHHIDRSFRRLQLKGDVVRLVCNVLLSQRQGDHLIFFHWYTFSPVHQRIRCSPGLFLQQCPGSFPLPFPVSVSDFHLFPYDNPKPAVLDSYNSPLSFICIFSIPKNIS